MANHVYFNVDLSVSEHSNKTNELTTELARLGTIISSETSHGWTEYDSNLLPIYPVPYEEDNWYNWGIEQMGAKWVSIEDWDTSGVFSGHSAWSPIYPLVENLVRHLDEVLDTQVWAKFTYEDEFRNFIGIHEAWVDGSDDVDWDYDECDGEEINHLILEAYGKDEEWFQSDEFDWWESYPITMENHAHKGEDWCVQEYADELVYQFFDRGRLEQLL